VLIAGVYVASTLLVIPAFPIRTLYDGEAPLLPYNWVVPPAHLAATNLLPGSGAGTVPVGLRPHSVSAADGQAVIIFPEGVIESREGESAAAVTITPLDPATVSPARPGLRHDGNAYRIEGRYANSGEPIVLRRGATIVLRYPVHATVLLRLTDAEWSQLAADAVPSTMQIFTSTDRLGTFVAAAPATARPAGLSLIAWWGYTTAVLGLALAAAGRFRSRGEAAMLSGRPRPAPPGRG
jgi:hypothetical protein